MNNIKFPIILKRFQRITTLIFILLFTQVSMANESCNSSYSPVDLCNKEAHEGITIAQFYLGRIYQMGKQVPKDNDKAKKWLLLAANSHNTEAQFFLALAYKRDGDNLNEIKWLHLAAEGGHAGAQFFLAMDYRFGKGINKNDDEAIKWLQLSANQGFALAQVSLGTIYHNGDGVPKDYTESAKWYCLAANQGSTDAQYYLGKMYAGGQGVQKDYIQAYKWTNIAASHNPEAKKFLRLLENLMTNSQINEGQKLSREWINFNNNR